MDAGPDCLVSRNTQDWVVIENGDVVSTTTAVALDRSKGSTSRCEYEVEFVAMRGTARERLVLDSASSVTVRAAMPTASATYVAGLIRYTPSVNFTLPEADPDGNDFEGATFEVGFAL